MDGHTSDRRNAGGSNKPPRDGNGKFVRGIDSVERDAEAMRLKHVEGWTYQQISDELGYGGRGHAYHAVARAMAATSEESREQTRRIVGAQIDHLVAVAYEVMERQHLTVTQSGTIVRDDDGNLVIDDGPTLAAIDRVNRLEEFRARLQGAPAPVKTHLTVEGSVDERERELLALIERLKTGEQDGDDGGDR